MTIPSLYNIPNGKKVYLNAVGSPNVGGSVGWYIPATNTLVSVYQDDAGTIPQTNPVTLDAAGSCVAFYIGQAREIVLDPAGNTLSDSIVTTGPVSATMAPFVAATSLSQAETLLGISLPMQPFVASSSLAAAATLLVGDVTTASPTLSNIAALRLATATTLTASVVYILGYTSLNDGGGGFFTLGSSGTDDGATIIVDASARQWYRVVSDHLTTKQAGCLANGSTDDTTAMNNWFTALGKYSYVGFVSAGVHLVGNGVVWDLAVTQRTSLRIDGAGPDLAVIKSTANVITLQVQDTGAGTAAFYQTFTNFSVAGVNTNGPVIAVMRYNAGDAANGMTFNNVVVNNNGGSASSVGVQINLTANCFFNFSINSPAGTAMQIAGPTAFSTFQGSYSGAHIGMWITNSTYFFANTLLNIDYEVVDICVQCDTASCSRNTWIGGQFVSIEAALAGGAGSAALNFSASGGYNLFINPNIATGTQPIFLNNTGYVGVKIMGGGYLYPATPSFPASGATVTNTSGYLLSVYIYNGAVTVVDINGAGISITTACQGNAGTYLWNPGETLSVTYTGGAGWLWKVIN